MIILWIPCKPASKGGFRSLLDLGAPVSDTPHPFFLACPPTHAVHALFGEGKAESGGPWEN